MTINKNLYKIISVYQHTRQQIELDDLGRNSQCCLTFDNDRFKSRDRYL